MRTNGGSYVHLFCATCGYEIGPFLNNDLLEVIQSWNESHRDVKKQKAGAAAFDNMLKQCNEACQISQKDPPIPKKFFGLFKIGSKK